jgi:hypothetical protein
LNSKLTAYAAIQHKKTISSNENLALDSPKILKCLCGTFSPNSCKKCSTSPEAKSQGAGVSGTKKQNSSKYKDASTSPKSSPLKAGTYEVKSPTVNTKADPNKDTAFSPKTENHYKRLSTLSINSNMRNAATSPKKESPAKTTERVLEKSNSLGDSKPQRALRTTKSLSPRNPVKHQHSIMVSDENDHVSVKLSPNEEFDEIKPTVTPAPKDIERKKKAVSETTSPNVSDFDSFKLDDVRKKNANNRSTSCLVYVPSDPWTKMSSAASPLPATKREQFKKMDAKSFSKLNLEVAKEIEDPWIWRSSTNLTDSSTNQKKLKHQTKSLTSSQSRIEKNLTLPGTISDEKLRKKVTRPKLQRSKSPSFYNELFTPDQQKPAAEIEKVASSTNISGSRCTCCDVVSAKCEKKAKITNSLTVLNPNANPMQARHSFSTTPSQRDDELPLNIRRLSDQIKYAPSYTPSFMNEPKQQTPSKKITEPLLETTC